MKKLIFFLVALCSCGSNPSSNSNATYSTDSLIFPAKNISFKYQVAPLLRRSCNMRYCHGDGVSFYNFENYLGLKYFCPIGNDPDTVGGMMELLAMRKRIAHPDPDTLKINSNERQGMIQWIHEGALNN